MARRKHSLLPGLLLLGLLGMCFHGSPDDSKPADDSEKTLQSSKQGESGVNSDDTENDPDDQQKEKDDQPEKEDGPEDDPAPSNGAALNVTVLDVGQGLSVYAECGRHTLLYDGGDREASSKVVSFLKSHTDSPLDAIICSHYHADHINGIVGALKTVGTHEIYGPDGSADSRVYESLMESIQADGLQRVTPEAGDTFKLADTTVEFITPLPYSGDGANNTSLAIQMTNGNKKVLLTGDAEKDEEAAMVQGWGSHLKSDVYVAGHHGSDTSSTSAFLSNVEPSYTIISCGRHNSYGHPAMDVIDRLISNGSKIYRTDLQGDIAFTIEHDTITFSLEPLSDEAAHTPNEPETPKEPDPEPAAPVQASDSSQAQDYILNTSSHKIHRPDCRSVAKMAARNKEAVHDTLEHLEAQGYEPCKICLR